VPGAVLLVQRVRSRLGYAADQGFSLVEVIVSITIFVVVATATAAAITNDIVAARTVRQRTQASSIAQSLLAGFQRSNTLPATFPTTAPGGWGVRISVNPAGGCTTGTTRTVTVLVFGPGVSTTSGKPAARTDSVIAC
jgi:prepilin-type N-terminal cleavage/methylation domain-containing protein